MSLVKQNRNQTASPRVMTFGENRDLDKVISAQPSGIQKRVNFNMAEEKHQRLKAACARQGASISDVMNDLVDSWLKDNE
ncbi:MULTISPECIES: plasmid partition protein ParG [Cronobacter]|uniref:plasmid partition protein ParG n=1 Tax=Cronobacter TaxID=413496 RepID=UPI000BE98718|nr:MULTISPECIES: plasmid partition protein ParG [Cronobacter]EKK4083710.1 DNA partition complex ParG [Cronobacter dublinensis]EKM6378839.1 DNA partition complex ParG [Cronobacter sakazakii]EKM7201644.1 DNA partition complex ParG [Cronobacter sakazakii]ELY4512550.1 DNA partition complex ParG [Cronobacter dublinensis]ELY6322377.1 DNA partition complex ParG [Cronobacter turicensis]